MADKDEQVEPSIAQDLVVTKYKMAAEMVNSKFMRISEIPLLYTYVRSVSCCMFMERLASDRVSVKHVVIFNVWACLHCAAK